MTSQTQFTFDRQYFSVPPVVETGTWRQVSKNQHNIEALKLFFGSRKGERVLLNNWGFNFDQSDDPYTSDELRSLILLEISEWFPDLPVATLAVIELSPGQYQADIEVGYQETEKVTIVFQ
jgi:hypothetical protein